LCQIYQIISRREAAQTNALTSSVQL